LPQVTIEYMIMVPILILQIFLFPIAAATIMGAWSNSRMTLELQEVSGNLGSSIQQLYYIMNHASISSGSLTAKLTVPTTIQDGDYGYNYMITLSNATNPNTSIKVMNITLSLIGASGKASTLVTLGENADWHDNATFRSNATSLISATKSSGTILLSFQGGT
jgi:hypothetical protein